LRNPEFSREQNRNFIPASLLVGKPLAKERQGWRSPLKNPTALGLVPVDNAILAD